MDIKSRSFHVPGNRFFRTAVQAIRKHDAENLRDYSRAASADPAATEQERLQNLARAALFAAIASWAR